MVIIKSKLDPWFVIVFAYSSNRLLDNSDGCKHKTLKKGANLIISFCQLDSNDAGKTNMLGTIFFLICFLTTSNAIICIVLPNPISSAKQAPKPRSTKKHNQLTPII